MKDDQIAKTILQQLGGRGRISMMIGAKQFTAMPDGVKIKFPTPKHKNAVNYVKITLNHKDLYDMEFFRIRGLKLKLIAKENDVYADMLVQLFEKNTGLYLTM